MLETEEIRGNECERLQWICRWQQGCFLSINVSVCLCVLVFSVCFGFSFALQRKEGHICPRCDDFSFECLSCLGQIEMFSLKLKGGKEMTQPWAENRMKWESWWLLKKSPSPACNSRYEKTWESSKILVVNKSAVTFSFLFFCFSCFVIHVKCVDTFCQNVTDCLKIELEKRVLFTSWQPWDKKWNRSFYQKPLESATSVCFGVPVAGNDKRLCVNISRNALVQAWQDGRMSLMRRSWLMSCTFLYHSSTLLLWYLCIFSESIKIYTAYKGLIVSIIAVNGIFIISFRNSIWNCK